MAPLSPFAANPNRRTALLTGGIAAIALVAAPLPAVAAPATAPSSGSSIRTMDVESFDYDADGIIDASRDTTIVLDSRGRELSRVTVERDAAGQALLTTDITRHFDARGQLTLRVTLVSGAEGLQAATYEERRYGPDGSPASVILSSDEDGDGVIDQVVTETVTAEGRITFESTAELDADGDGAVDDVTRTLTVYDRRGHEVSRTVTNDVGADGTIEMTETQISTYGQRGALETTATTITIGGSSSTITVRYGYDSRGLLVERTQVESPNDATYAATYEYDASGRLVRSVENIDGDGDGIVERTDTRDETFDARGRLLHSLALVNATNESGFGSLASYEYGSGEAATSGSTEFDYGLDGVVDTRLAFVATVDARGRVLERIDTFDFDANGALDRTIRQLYTYGRDGEIASILTETDDDGDGVIDSTTTYTRTVG